MPENNVMISDPHLQGLFDPTFYDFLGTEGKPIVLENFYPGTLSCEDEMRDNHPSQEDNNQLPVNHNSVSGSANQMNAINFASPEEIMSFFAQSSSLSSSITNKVSL